jgi:hypothetical protein
MIRRYHKGRHLPNRRGGQGAGQAVFCYGGGKEAAMFVMILLAAATSAATASPVAIFPPRETPAQASEAGADCLRLAPRVAGEEDWVARSRPRRLIDLPPGRLELAVQREVDGCVIPVVLREGIGAAAEDQRRR